MFNWFRKRKKKNEVVQVGSNNVAVQQSTVRVTSQRPVSSTPTRVADDTFQTTSILMQNSFYEDDSHKHSYSSHSPSSSHSHDSGYSGHSHDSSSYDSSSSSDSGSSSDW